MRLERVFEDEAMSAGVAEARQAYFAAERARRAAASPPMVTIDRVAQLLGSSWRHALYRAREVMGQIGLAADDDSVHAGTEVPAEVLVLLMGMASPRVPAPKMELSEHIRERLEAVAEETGQSLGELVDEALGRYLPPPGGHRAAWRRYARAEELVREAMDADPTETRTLKQWAVAFRGAPTLNVLRHAVDVGEIPYAQRDKENPRSPMRIRAADLEGWLIRQRT
jgi:hypothetical protein